MKREDGVYCNKCHTLIAPKDPSQLNYGKVDYHGECMVKFIREQKARKAS